mgnify:FL=1
MATPEGLRPACLSHGPLECRCEGCLHEIRSGAGPGRAFPKGLYDRFVEALSEALDIREMETGVSSGCKLIHRSG